MKILVNRVISLRNFNMAQERKKHEEKKETEKGKQKTILFS